MVESGETESGDESGHSLNELYNLPTAGDTITLPDCTPTDVSADWSICPPEGSGGANRLANMMKNRLEIACTYAVMDFGQMLALKNLPKNVRTLAPDDQRTTYLKGMESRTGGF
jgi:hypothetical protein